MDQVEKRSRLRLTKRCKRKLSLPALLSQFHLQRDALSPTSEYTSKLEAIAASPVRLLQCKKSHSSTPSSTDKVSRSHSLSSTGELEAKEKFNKIRRLDSKKTFGEDSTRKEIFKKCTRRLDATESNDVFSPNIANGSSEAIDDYTQIKFSKLSSTLLSPIPVCDSWLTCTASTTPRLDYNSSTNIEHKDVCSGELDDCENEVENIEDEIVTLNQNTAKIPIWDPIPLQTKMKGNSKLKRKKCIRRSTLDSNNVQNNSNKEDNSNPEKIKKDQEFTENPNEGDILYTNSKEIDCNKDLVTIIEFLKDPLVPVQDSKDPNKETWSRLTLPIETSLPQSPGEGCRTPVYPMDDNSQADGLCPKIKGLESEHLQTLGKIKPNKSPNLTPKRKGVQKRFPWISSTDENVCLLDKEKTDRNEMISFSKEGQFRGIRESKKNKRWSSIFPASDENVRMDLLSQKLDFYNKNGLKIFLSNINLNRYQVPDAALESSWQCLVDYPDLLSKERRQQQSAIWELVTTEITYLNTLKVIADIFLSCLVNLQTDSLLNEIDTKMLFSNIQDIYAANLVLWHEHIWKMLEFSRSTGQPLDPTFLFDAFCKIEDILYPYTQYCLEQSICQEYCRDNDFENIYFKTYLAWCETQRECNRLRLADILVTPMQRLTKYSLLLQAIAKKTTEEDYKTLLEEMICSVDKFVSKVNNTMRFHHDQKMIWDISAKIEAYDVVESKEEELVQGVCAYSQLNLQQSMPGCLPHHQRSIFFHGDMKLRDAQTSKLDVHVYIFTDMLLITKFIQKKAEKLKIIRPPFQVSRLVVIDVKDVTSVGLIYINEWNLAEASFTLQCHNEQLQKAWIQTLKQAQKHYKTIQESKDTIDDTYVSELPMYTRDLETSNCIQSLEIGTASLGTSPNIDSVCTSGVSSVVPNKDFGASPNIYSSNTSSKDFGSSPNMYSTNTSGISSLVTSNYGTGDLSHCIPINSSDKFDSPYFDDLIKEYTLEITNKDNQLINKRKVDEAELTSSMWIGYSSMPGSPEHIQSSDDLEDSGFVSGNILRIPVKYGTDTNFLSPNTKKYSYKSEDRFSPMKNISYTPINNYISTEEIILPSDEVREKAFINIQDNTSEDPINEHTYCTRINIAFDESQKKDPVLNSENRFGNDQDKSSISKGCFKTMINISPMKCNRSNMASNISSTYIYQESESEITFGPFSYYVTEGNKQNMNPTKSFQDEYSCTIKIDKSEVDPEVSNVIQD